MIRDPLELPFDQYQRYRIVADLLAGLRDGAKALTILDVGGRTANLRAFLPKDRVYLVDVDPSDEPGLVLGDGARLPYKDRAFDVVAAFDTLEHVPPQHRAAFLRECARVAKKWIVVAGPYQSAAVDESERLLQRFLRDKLGVEHRYLDEHRHNGLPDLAGSLAALEESGARTAAIGHGNLERWLPLMCLSLYLDHEPGLRGLAKAVFRFYNRELYASDHAEPVYRHALIGAIGDAPLPAAIPGLAPPLAPAGVLARFDEVLGELASFDRVRADWKVERERLWEMARTLEQDLVGHRESLAAERALRAGNAEVVRTLEVDLSGHRAALAAARDELARTQAAVLAQKADADAQRADAQAQQAAFQLAQSKLAAETSLVRAVLAGSEQAREEERALRTRLENDVDRLTAEVQSLRADLRGHRESLAEERKHLAATRDVLATERADLAGHRAALGAHRERVNVLEAQVAERSSVLDRREAEIADLRAASTALQSEIAARDAVIRDVSADLAGHRAALRDTRAEAERLRVDLETAMHERNVEQQRLEGAHGELARVARILQEQDRTLQALRADLRSRAKSLRRALGPTPPTP